MNKIEVMIIEDDARASYLLETTINQYPDFHVIAVAESCKDALLQYRVYQPALIFVDITLPDGSGLSVIRALRNEYKKCDFIMTTALRDTAIIEQAIQLGVRDYLVKPLRISRVGQALNDFVQYKEQITQNQKIDQSSIDKLFKRDSVTPPPKGINQQTLEKIKHYLFTDNADERPDHFSAQELGMQLQISRVTVRRYLEFLETQGLIRLELNYNTGGRPKRVYHILKENRS